MPDLHLADARIHYAVDGERGPLVLFLHGALASGQAFRGQLPGLRGDHRTVLMDQRGHGRSSHFGEETPWDTLHPDTLVNDALAIIDLVSPHAPVHIVGASMGGLVGALLAERHAPRVETLTLWSTPSDHDPRWQAFFRDTPPEALPITTQRLGAQWHGARYWPELARGLFQFFADPPDDVYATAPRPQSGRALVMQGTSDELLSTEDADTWARRIGGEVHLERPPGDHAFFADGRAGTRAANSALATLLKGRGFGTSPPS